MGRKRRLLTVGHSYVVGLNRRLAHELALANPQEQWAVTCVAPKKFYGHHDFAPLIYRPTPDDEPCTVRPVHVWPTFQVHTSLYGLGTRSILNQPWDVLHIWEEPYVASGWQLARWAPKAAKVVYWTHQNLPKRYPQPFAWFERDSMSRAAAWTAGGFTTADVLRNRPGYEMRNKVVPLGVDTEYFAPAPAAGKSVREALGWQDSGPAVVGYLGRFVPEKGLTLLMDALDRVTAPWRALFVGAGPMKGQIERWAKKHGDRVRIVAATHNQVPAHINAMDMLCAPSQTTPDWREQFGRMSIEAFACGVPVIGSDSGEIPFIIEPAGVVVGEADLNGWAEAIAQLVDNPVQRRELGAKGLDLARSQYAWPVIARSYLDLFTELLDGQGRASPG